MCQIAPPFLSVVDEGEGESVASFVVGLRVDGDRD